jgi:DNA-binding MarR family transcriptional regulator
MVDSAEILNKLARLEQLLLLLTRTQLEPVLQKEFADPKMRKLYDLTGTHGQREIKKELNMSANTISDAWKRWERMGLLVKEGQEYRKVI